MHLGEGHASKARYGVHAHQPLLMIEIRRSIMDAIAVYCRLLLLFRPRNGVHKSPGLQRGFVFEQ